MVLINKQKTVQVSKPLKNISERDSTLPTNGITLEVFNKLPNIVCPICKGYIINATKITECLCTCECKVLNRYSFKFIC